MLGKIALHHKSVLVRRAATEKVTDQKVLKKIVNSNRADVYMLVVAVRRLTDQDEMVKIARKHDSMDVRSAAIKKLTDQNLAKIGMWVDPKRTDLITDQTFLAQIAVDAKDAIVRMTATKKLTDQTVLMKIVGNKREYDFIREAAVTRLTDQNELAKIAVEENQRRVRRAAAEKLTDSTLLAKMGMWVKPDLTQEITDQTLLARIGEEAKDILVRAIAVSKLTEDTEVLRKIGNGKDTIAALARLRLALLDPRVDSRIGSVTIKCTIKIIKSKKTYNPIGFGKGISLNGEDCNILVTDSKGNKLSDTSHVTKFPRTVNSLRDVSANPEIQPILSSILKNGTFKPAELSAIAADTTAVKELRDAAASGVSN